LASGRPPGGGRRSSGRRPARCQLRSGPPGCGSSA